MLIRVAAEGDSDDIAKLEMVLFPDNCFNETTIQHEANEGLCFTLYEGSDLAGYLLGRFDGDLLDVLRLGIAPAYQRRGLGSALLQAVRYENPNLMLTVHKQNAGALRLYFRHGFHIVGELPSGAWVMCTP